MKQRTSKQLKSLYIDTGVDDLIRELEEYKIQYSEYDLLWICTETNYDGSDDIYLKGERLETDEEEQARMSREEAAERKNTEWQLKQYELLKQKFEKR